MIEVREGRWLHFDDLAREIPGREDSPETIELCWRYLASGAERKTANALRSPELARTVMAEVVAARVRASTVMRLSPQEIEERLEAQDAAIDRLLAFVPTRAAALSPKRLDRLGQLVQGIAAEVFRGAGTRLSITREEAADSAACHRLVLEVDQGSDLDPMEFVRASAFVHARLAQSVSSDEFQAVRLFIEPNLGGQGERG